METLSIDKVVGETLAAMRGQLFQKGAGAKAVVSLQRAFALADIDGSGALDREEFEEALGFAGLFVKSHQLSALVKAFDTSGDGVVDCNEFLVGLRGEESGRRKEIVAKAFASLDASGAGSVALADVVAGYNAAKHPDVQQGRCTADDALADLKSGFPAAADTGVVTAQDFANYYQDVGCGVPSDDYFCELISATWGVNEGDMDPKQAEKLSRYVELIKEKVRQKAQATDAPSKQLRSTFKFFDADDTGSVDVDEMTAALAQLGLPLHRKDVLLFFQIYDKDGSGTLDYSEFIKSLYD